MTRRDKKTRGQDDETRQEGIQPSLEYTSRSLYDYLFHVFIELHIPPLGHSIYSLFVSFITFKHIGA